MRRKNKQDTILNQKEREEGRKQGRKSQTKANYKPNQIGFWLGLN